MGINDAQCPHKFVHAAYHVVLGKGHRLNRLRTKGRVTVWVHLAAETTAALR